VLPAGSIASICWLSVSPDCLNGSSMLFD
jgi:hypothetical protein